MKSWTLYQHSLNTPLPKSPKQSSVKSSSCPSSRLERSQSSQSHVHTKSKSQKLFKSTLHQPSVASIGEHSDEAQIVYLPKNVTSKLWARGEINRRNTLLREVPFQTLNLSQLVRRYQLWRQMLPNVHPHYAVKVNDHPLILRTLASLGCGFDCASEGEIKKVLKIGVSTDRIIFAHTTKPASHIRYALHAGVNLCTVDTLEELDKINKWHPSMKVILRVAVKNEFTEIPFDTKFGCRPKDVELLMRKSFDLGIPVVGVSFHIGSYSCSGSPFALGIRQARDAFDIGKECGHNDMKILDIGGGYPGDTETTQFKQFAVGITEAIQEYFCDLPEVRVVSEPGTFFAKSPATLYTSIIAKKKVQLNLEDLKENVPNGTIEPDLQRVYYISTGVYGPFMDHFVSLSVNYIPSDYISHKEVDRDHVYRSKVFGPTCDPLDEVNADCLLPELAAGDWLEYPDEGAYSLPFFSEFNGFPVPDTVVLVEHKHRKYFEKHVQKVALELEE